MEALIAVLVLSLTVFAAVGVGVMTASWVVNGILYVFSQRQHPKLAPVLIPSETHGD